MTTPYTVLVIKPLTVSRGHAPFILSEVLGHCPVSLRMFREWSLCDTTLYALSQDACGERSDWGYEIELVHAIRNNPSWICLFTHLDRVTDPTSLLQDYCGPNDRRKWLPSHLKGSYGGLGQHPISNHPSDTVIHISSQTRAFHEANMMFLGFKEEDI